MARAEPLVSILVNNFNYSKYLRACIDSALAQTHKNFEVIVTDDGSTDDSRDIIDSYGSDLVRVYKRNGGQASAFNAGMLASKGEIICFLDADDWFLPEKLVRICDIYENNAIGWVYHGLIRFDSDKNISIGHTPVQAEGVIDERVRLKRKGTSNLFLPATSGFTFRRSVLQEILPMPESHEISISDKYLGMMGVASARGFYTNQRLSVLRLHGKNRYSGRTNKMQRTGEIAVNTAYWMKQKSPTLSLYADRLMAKGSGILTHYGVLTDEHQRMIKEFRSTLSIPAKMKLSVRSQAYKIYCALKK